MQADGCHAMSGSNAMCVTTVLLETGMLPMAEPTTRVALDTPAGLVTAEAACRDGRCERVTLEFVPSFVEHLDQPLEVEGCGTLAVDVAYGGDYFCLVDAGRLRLPGDPGRGARHGGARPPDPARRAPADPGPSPGDPGAARDQLRDVLRRGGRRRRAAAQRRP